MKGLIRIIGLLTAASVFVLVATLTVAVLKKVWFDKPSHGKGHLAVVDLVGVITDAGPFIEKMDEIRRDVGAKGVIVRINSPGGMVGPSQEMYESIKRVDKLKPVYVSMGSVAASGGYYAAMGARKVYASAGTLTASVGVIAEFVNTEKLVQWAKVERRTLKAGKLKDVGSPTRAMEPEEKEFLLAMLKDIHLEFQRTVQESRKLSDEQVKRYLDGRVMTGNQAAEAKLVDTLGGYELAAADLKKEVGLPEDADEIKFVDDEGLLRKLLWGNKPEGAFRQFSESLAGLAKIGGGIPSASGWNVLMLAPIAFTQP